MERDLFIVVAGNIGVGKTTLARELATMLQGRLFEEPVNGNPYLEDFYADPKRWAFEFQLFMLSHRVEQHLQIAYSRGVRLEDRGVLEDTLFAEMLHRDGVLDERAWRTYLDHYGRLSRHLVNPDVILYLDATPEECLDRVRERGRPCEKSLPLFYLQSLDSAYRGWLEAIEGKLNVTRLPWHDGDRDPRRAVDAIEAASGAAVRWRERWGRHLP